MSQDKKFIKTTDKETADRLMMLGFQLVTQIGSTYTFLNEVKKLDFEVVDKKKIVYDNNLSL
jgi:hypothetical protein